MNYSGDVKFGMGYGGADERVRWVQQRLLVWKVPLKSATGGRPDDGQFGSGTRAAVSTFQRTSGLPATGVVDRATWNALARNPGQPATVTTPSTGWNNTGTSGRRATVQTAKAEEETDWTPWIVGGVTVASAIVFIAATSKKGKKKR